MTESYNIQIPPSIIRLGVDMVNRLVVIGLTQTLTQDIIYEQLHTRYERKRTAKSLVRTILTGDLDYFNSQIDDMVKSGVSPKDRLRIDTVYFREICQVLKLK